MPTDPPVVTVDGGSAPGPTRTDAAPVEPAIVEFVEFHQPALTDGLYAVKATQHVTYAGKIAHDADFTTVEHRFRVAGERFHLNPADVVAAFPPNGSTGDHSMVLPHLVLRRSTLPWERYSLPRERHQPPPPDGTTMTTTPWLALLVFNEADLAHVTTRNVPFSELGGTASPPVRFPNLDPEDERPTDSITVIDLPWNLFWSVTPAPLEVRLLTHVRQTAAADGTPVGDDVAVLMASRLPENGQSTTVHLVSLEGWFAADGTPIGSEFRSAPTVRLVTLHSWTFSCSGDSGALADRLRRLNRPAADGASAARADLPYLRLARASGTDPLIDLGGVPLTHQLRDGGRTVSVYRGPLVPSPLTDQIDDGVDLPVACSDDLLVFDEDIGVLEVGEAAAWELGRLLTIRSTRVANELAAWKRNQARLSAGQRQALADPHLPSHQRAARRGVPGQPTLPPVVEAWFADLRLLKGLPFHYLVADESMLPPESVRCFTVDPHWMRALLDGAFSIGRVTSRDHQGDRELATTIAAVAPMSGVLVRSSVVAGWPDMIVEAASTRVSDGELPADSRLTLLRMQRLSPEVLLCLFAGPLGTLDLAQKPETLHFGVDPDGSRPPVYSKRLRNTVGAEFGLALSPVPWRFGDAALRRIDVVALANQMREALATHQGSNPTSGGPGVPPEVNSGWFALEMIEGVQKVRFTVSG